MTQITKKQLRWFIQATIECLASDCGASDEDIAKSCFDENDINRRDEIQSSLYLEGNERGVQVTTPDAIFQIQIQQV